MAKKKYYSNYLGIVIDNADPKQRGRCKIFVPHLSTNLLEGWIKDKKDKNFKFIGDNIETSLNADIIDRLKKHLPWAEAAMPIFGGSSSGIYTPENRLATVSHTTTTGTSDLNNSSDSTGDVYGEDSVSSFNFNAYQGLFDSNGNPFYQYPQIVKWEGRDDQGNINPGKIYYDSVASKNNGKKIYSYGLYQLTSGVSNAVEEFLETSSFKDQLLQAGPIDSEGFRRQWEQIGTNPSSRNLFGIEQERYFINRANNVFVPRFNQEVGSRINQSFNSFSSKFQEYVIGTYHQYGDPFRNYSQSIINQTFVKGYQQGVAKGLSGRSLENYIINQVQQSKLNDKYFVVNSGIRNRIKDDLQYFTNTVILENEFQTPAGVIANAPEQQLHLYDKRKGVSTPIAENLSSIPIGALNAFESLNSTNQNQWERFSNINAPSGSGIIPYKDLLRPYNSQIHGRCGVGVRSHLYYITKNSHFTRGLGESAKNSGTYWEQSGYYNKVGRIGRNYQGFLPGDIIVYNNSGHGHVEIFLGKDQLTNKEIWRSDHNQRGNSLKNDRYNSPTLYRMNERGLEALVSSNILSPDQFAQLTGSTSVQTLIAEQTQSQIIPDSEESILTASIEVIRNTNATNPYAITPDNFGATARGFFSIPNVGAHVWVFFQDGDPQYPVYFAAASSHQDWQGVYKTYSDAPDYPQASDNYDPEKGKVRNVDTDPNSNGNDEGPVHRHATKLVSEGGSLVISSIVGPAGVGKRGIKLTAWSGSYIDLNESANIFHSAGDEVQKVTYDRWAYIGKDNSYWVQRNEDYTVGGNQYVKVGDLNIQPYLDLKQELQDINNTWKQIPNDLPQISNPLLEAQYVGNDKNKGYFKLNLPFFPNPVYIPTNFSSLIGGRKSGREILGENTSLKEQIIDYSKNSLAQEQQIRSLLESKQQRITEIEAKMGLGGSRTTIITKDELIQVGLVINDLDSYTIIPEGKLIPNASRVTQEGVATEGTMISYVKGINTDSLPGGNYQLIVANKYSLLVGAKGIDVKTNGPISIHGGITDISGVQLNLSSQNELILDGGQFVNLVGDNVLLKGRGGQVFVDSNLNVNKNAIIGGSTHVEGELSFQHATCPSREFDTDYSSQADIVTLAANWQGEAIAKNNLNLIQKRIKMSQYPGYQSSPLGLSQLQIDTENSTKLEMVLEPNITGICYGSFGVGFIQNFVHNHGLNSMDHKHTFKGPNMNLLDNSKQVRGIAERANSPARMSFINDESPVTTLIKNIV